MRPVGDQAGIGQTGVVWLSTGQARGATQLLERSSFNCSVRLSSLLPSFSPCQGWHMAAISLDLRARILAARQAGETTAEVADRFDVSPAFVRRLLQRYRESGSLAPKATPRGSKP